MKEEWLFPEAVVPVDAETTAALVAEIHRLIDVVGGMALAQPDAFEQGRQEGMKQERALWELTKLGQEIEAQPEQEPAAYLVTGPYEKQAFSSIDSANSYCNGLNKGFGEIAYSVSPLYTTPPKRPWVGLTDEEKRQIFKRDDYQSWFDYINAIEAKLKEKNT